MIIVEGPDNAGKTTLIHNHLLPLLTEHELKMTEGPGKSKGEIDERIRRYNKLKKVICDRHPTISETIYSLAFGRSLWVTLDHLHRTLSHADFIIFCLPPDRLLIDEFDRNHVVNDTIDTDEHLALVRGNLVRLVEEYRRAYGAMKILDKRKVLLYDYTLHDEHWPELKKLITHVTIQGKDYK